MIQNFKKIIKFFFKTQLKNILTDIFFGGKIEGDDINQLYSIQGVSS